MTVDTKAAAGTERATGTPVGSPEVREMIARIRTGDSPMRRDEVLAVLQTHRPVFVERFDVERLTLFGSVARDEAEPDSDLDLLVEFTGAKDASGYPGVDSGIVWRTIVKDIPPLRTALRALLAAEPA